MLFLRSLMVVTALVWQVYAVDVSLDRQSSCRSTGTVNIGVAQIVFTPSFPSVYSTSASCSWSYTSAPGGFLTVRCAGSVPCTDSFTIASSPGINSTFCGVNSILVTAGPAVNITIKPSSTSAGGVGICIISAQASPLTTLSPTTPAMTTKLPLTTQVQTTLRPTISPPKTTSVPLTTPHPPTIPPRTTPVTTSPASTPKPTIPGTPATIKPSSNCTCGIEGPAFNRIIGGSPAGQLQFPWMVMLIRNMANSFCGGSIIAPGWILTAAHCFKEFNLTNARVTAIAGRYSLTANSATQQLREAVQLFVHPLYNFTSNVQDNDIALLKLASGFTFGSGVSPICLPMAFPTFDFANQTGVAAGWGRTSYGGTQSDTLLQVTLPMFSTSQCKQTTVSHLMTNNMICTYAPGRGTCQIDSGGPLMWVDPTSKRTMVAGITSWGVGCGGSYPTGFTKVSNYLSWIQTTTGEKFCSP